MAHTLVAEEQVTAFSLVLDCKNVGITQEQFFQLCRDNQELNLELSAQKELVIMSLPGGATSRRNAILTTELTNWARADGTGYSFDCGCLFVLPNGANRGPDMSWVKRERWNALSREEQDSGVPLCPDFVGELMSKSDRLKTVKAKMEEYLANGARLGWLIDPYKKRVHIYRPGQPVEVLEQPSSVSGNPVLPGFVLDLTDIW